VVLDVMMGSGMSGVSALRLGRDFIGIDKDKEKFKIARGRILNFIEDKSSMKCLNS